jgi:hypothetical protein
VPPQAIGRGMSLFNTTAMMAGLVGLSSGGYMMQQLGIPTTLVIGCMLDLVAISLVLRVRKATPAPQPVPSVAEP